MARRDPNEEVLDSTNEPGQRRNLNDMVEEGFDTIPDEEPLVLAQPPEQGQDDNFLRDSRLFEGVIEVGRLPKLNAEFEIQEDRVSRTVEIMRKHTDINHRGLISVEDMKEVDSLAPGFINPEQPIGLFTHEPTKTNFKEGMDNMTLLLERQYDELRNSLKELIENYSKTFSPIPTKVTQKMTDCISTFNKKYAQLLSVSEKNDICHIQYVFDNRLRWFDFLNKDYSGIAYEGQVDLFEGTFLQGYQAKIFEIAYKSDVNRFLKIVNQTDGLYIHIGRRLHKRVEGDQMVHVSPEEEQKIIDSCYGDAKIISLVRDLISPDTTKTAMFLINKANENITRIKATSALSEQIQTSDTQLPEKIKALAEASSVANEAVFRNYQILDTLEAVFDLYTLFTEVICKFIEKQTPPPPTEVEATTTTL